ncbi:non-homologous end-joining DNA ligase [Dyadobacter sp. NIV53]|uniref:non-homologous end-joining DNA ligase n=1 Tax=Dyadobacter sp. NIV53 TaxID=2861765 RepID=UPI001C880991|nr:non-homologous end-joining DNA ligase [Dyadobacter sp. NIV53]
MKKKVSSVLEKAPIGDFDPDWIPMLATLTDAPFENEGWEYEVKWDGYRALAFVNEEDSQLKSRNNISFNRKFPPVLEAIKKWNVHAVVDGEIVVVNKNGIADFGSLQNWRSESDGELLFYVFDILWMEGKILTGIPLSERKALLKSILPKNSIIRSGYSVKSDGISFFEAAKKLGLEGIMAKRSDSNYLPGVRTKDWLKIKIQKRQEVIIVGYTRNEGTSKLFSSLLLGVYNNNILEYAGKVGTGFKDKQQKELLKIFETLIISSSPFTAKSAYNRFERFRGSLSGSGIVWIKPVIVCEVHFSEVTTDGVFRHPSFVGLREDKQAKEVIIETEAGIDSINLLY